MTRQEEKQMKRIAKFHKVSKERFTADWIDTFAQSQEEAEKVYEAIRLPKRATAGSAGYDFFAPAEFTLKPGETVKIPTGIRVEMQSLTPTYLMVSVIFIFLPSILSL